MALRPHFPFEIAHREGGRLDFFSPPAHVLSAEPRVWPQTGFVLAPVVLLGAQSGDHLIDGQQLKSDA